MLAVVAFLLSDEGFQIQPTDLADAFAPLEHELHMLQMRSGIHSLASAHKAHLLFYSRCSAVCQLC